VLGGDGQDAARLRLGRNLDHDARVEAVEGGVGAVGEAAHGVGDDALRRHEGSNLRLKRGVAAVLEALAVHVAVARGLGARLAD